MAKLYAKSPSGEDALLSISITGFTQSLQQNGWCKLPNGLLLQWSGRAGTFGDVELIEELIIPILFPITICVKIIDSISSISPDVDPVEYRPRLLAAKSAIAYNTSKPGYMNYLLFKKGTNETAHIFLGF